MGGRVERIEGDALDANLQREVAGDGRTLIAGPAVERLLRIADVLLELERGDLGDVERVVHPDGVAVDLDAGVAIDGEVAQRMGERRAPRQKRKRSHDGKEGHEEEATAAHFDASSRFDSTVASGA